MSLKRLLAAVLTLMIVVGTVAFTSTGKVTATKKEQSVTVGLENSPKSLDPRVAKDAASQEVSSLIFDSLYRLDKNMNPQPWLVTKLTMDGDKTYVFTIKKGVKFQNGKELTAADVKYTIDSIMDPKLTSHLRSKMQYVKNIQVIDDYTIRVELSQVYVSFLSNLTFGIVPVEAQGMGDQFGKMPIGSGAYKLIDFQPDVSITLAANDSWFKGKPSIEKAVFKIIPDDGTRLTTLEMGQIDLVLDGVLPSDYERLVQNRALTVDKTIGTDYEYVGMNLTKEPFKDNVKLRQAIAYALDKDAITKNFGGYRTYVSLPPNNWAYTDKVNHYDLDLEKAKRLLVEAGYPDGLTIELKTAADHAAMAQIIKENLKPIGITIDIQQRESSTYLKDLHDGNMVMYLHAWAGQIDPDQYNIYHSTQIPPIGANRNHYANAEVDRIYTEGRKTLDQAERTKLYAHAFDIVFNQDLPFIPLYTNAVINVYKSNIKGLEIAPFPVTILQSLPFAHVE